MIFPPYEARPLHAVNQTGHRGFFQLRSFSKIADGQAVVSPKSLKNGEVSHRNVPEVVLPEHAVYKIIHRPGSPRKKEPHLIFRFHRFALSFQKIPLD
jgi:hypothetical protein